MVKSLALTLAIILGIGTIIPLATQQVEAGPRAHRSAKHYKKYSKRWWRQYRARKQRKHALQARKRALRLIQLRLAKAHDAEKATGQVTPSKPAPVTAKKADTSAAAVLPSGEPAPKGWKVAQSSPAEVQFRVDNPSGDQVGSASISVVGPAMPSAGESSSKKSVGGVSTASLRRDVIDRMIKENGWVVNDYLKEISGQNVYVVVAQSQAKNGGVQSRMFYFTEVDGRIYSVATNSPVQSADQLAEESEKVINSLKSRVHSTQRAAVKD